MPLGTARILAAAGHAQTVLADLAPSALVVAIAARWVDASALVADLPPSTVSIDAALRG